MTIPLYYCSTHIDPSQIASVDIGLMGPNEVKKIAVVKVDNSCTVNGQRGKSDAINDLRMGPCDKFIRCATCRNAMDHCNQHPGYISLPYPVYNLGSSEILNRIVNTLRGVCFWCAKLLIPLNDPIYKNYIDLPLKERYNKFCVMFKHNNSKKPRHCIHCERTQPKYVKEENSVCIKTKWNSYPRDLEEKEIAMKPFTAREALCILGRISDRDYEIMGTVPKLSRLTDGIITKLIVPPPIVRPSMSEQEGFRSRGQDDLTKKLKQIVDRCTSMRKYIEEYYEKKGISREERMLHDIPYEDDFVKAVQELQLEIGTYLTNKVKCPKPSVQKKSGAPMKAVLDRLKGKDGRVRGNLMGKRCDYTGRTVITPDPNIDINEIGIPEEIAIELTYPERITSFNIKHCMAMIDIGPKVIGGALSVITPEGKYIHLEKGKNANAKVILRVGYVINRHLRNGDICVINRQPSLHKPSMMGHWVRICSSKTIRLHPSCTTPYNADFDGDEMNIHVPQSETARAEVMALMAVPNMIVSPQSNKNTMGLVQDALLGIFLFTRKNTFLDRAQVCQLLSQVHYPIDGGFLKLPEPAIILNKGRECYWTGKQIFSKLLPPYAMLKKGIREWAGWIPKGNDKNSMPNDDDHILIKNGELLTGVLCKQMMGCTSGSLIHILYKDCGPWFTARFLSDCQRMIDEWLSWRGLTVCSRDCNINQKTQEALKKTVEVTFQKANEITKKTRDTQQYMKERGFKSSIDMMEAEQYITTINNATLIRAGNIVLNGTSIDKNGMTCMVNAGSKGQSINLGLMSGMIGQQTTGGMRIMSPTSSRTLPDDPHGQIVNDIRSNGFVVNCFSKGITPKEFFIVCMGGREGIVDTSVKTSESGYQQRRITKASEGHGCDRRGVVTNPNGDIVEFCYGNDGMDGTFVEKVHQPFLLCSNQVISDKISWGDEPICKLEYERILKYREEIRGNHHGILKPNMDAVSFIPIDAYRVIKFLYCQYKLNAPKEYRELITPKYLYHEVDDLCLSIDNFNRVSGQDEDYIGLRNTTHLKMIFVSVLISKRLIHKNHITVEFWHILKQHFLDSYEKCMVADGEMVGIIGAQSSGERCTQLSFSGDTDLCVNSNKDSYIFPIGSWVEKMILTEPSNNVCYYNDTDTTIVSNLNSPYSIPSTNDKGDVEWKRVIGWTRHPPNGPLIRVKTESGRLVEATLAKSFLTLKRGKVLPIKGSKLKIGDVLPISIIIPDPPSFKSKHIINDYTFILNENLGNFFGLYFRVSDNERLYIDIQSIQPEWDFLNFLGINKYEYAKYEISPTHPMKIWLSEINKEGNEISFMRFISSCNSKFCKGFINSYLKIHEKGYSYINTTDLVIAQYLQHLCIRCGYWSIIQNQYTESKPHLLIVYKNFPIEVSTLSNVYWDPITHIEIFMTKDKYVYDITVEGTFNFSLLNGLQVRDTLNTFHYAGVSAKNVTHGFSRMKELMDLTEKMKRPAMKICLKPPFCNSKKGANIVKRVIESIYFSKVVKYSSVIKEPNNDIPLEELIQQNDETEFTLGFFHMFELSNYHQYRSTHILKFDLDKIFMIEKGLTPRDIERAIKLFVGPHAIVYVSEYNMNKWCLYVRFMTLFHMIEKAKLMLNQSNVEDVEIILCENLQTLLLKKVRIAGITGIKKAHIVKQKNQYFDKDGCPKEKEEWMIETEGMNLIKILGLPYIDTTRTYCNDPKQTFEILGIEACNNILFKETRGVLSFDGTYIDSRHINHIANTMCYKGVPHSMSRHGIISAQTNQFLSACSFEETDSVIYKAAIQGERNNILSKNSVTGPIMLGQIAPIGTGIVTVMTSGNSEKMKSWEEKNNHSNNIINAKVFEREKIISTRKPIYSWIDAIKEYNDSEENMDTTLSIPKYEPLRRKRKLMQTIEPVIEGKESFVPTSPHNILKKYKKE